MGFLGLGGEQAKLEINKAGSKCGDCSLPHPEESRTGELFSNEHRTRAVHLLLISLTDIHLNLKGFPGLGSAKEGPDFLLRLNSCFVVVAAGSISI